MPLCCKAGRKPEQVTCPPVLGPRAGALGVCCGPTTGPGLTQEVGRGQQHCRRPGLRPRLGQEEEELAAYHAVLYVQHVGLRVVPLEERPVQPQILQLLILDHRPQLLVVPKENHLEGGQAWSRHPRTQRDPAPWPSPLGRNSSTALLGDRPGPGTPAWGFQLPPASLTFSACENFTRGMRVSGSVAMPASSMRICRTFSFLRLARAAHEQVQRMTVCRSSSNFRAFPRTILYLRGVTVWSSRDTIPPPTSMAEDSSTALTAYKLRSSLEKTSPFCSRASNALMPGA